MRGRSPSLALEPRTMVPKPWERAINTDTRCAREDAYQPFSDLPADHIINASLRTPLAQARLPRVRRLCALH